jgi:hypothetical protein
MNCENCLKAVHFVYDNRDKVVILGAISAFAYYSISTLIKLFEFYDRNKHKPYEAYKNVQNITDYLSNKKRCNECDACFKYGKSFRKHKLEHEVSDEYDRIFSIY